MQNRTHLYVNALIRNIPIASILPAVAKNPFQTGYIMIQKEAKRMSTRTTVGMNSVYEKNQRTEKGGRIYKIKNAVDKVNAKHS